MIATTRWTAVADGAPHVREVATLGVAIARNQYQSVVVTALPYAETDRVLATGVRATFRVGAAALLGDSAPPGSNLWHHAFAGIADGSVRAERGPWSLELRYDRSPYLTSDDLRVLGDRLTMRAARNAPAWQLSTSAFAATSKLWDVRGVGHRDWTDGVDLRGQVRHGRWSLAGTVEAAHDDYPRDGAVAISPEFGWRMTVDVACHHERVRAPSD
ncbi:MAG: hypothetical protein KBI14_34170 [Kofleriaceae bacterium]|nr:hypothetical protein [Kofleriaceae bacterium]MBP9861056.1 hypothetical protein [Kofleriaceae bacterium]